MSKRLRREKGLTTSILIITLILACGAFMGLKNINDNIPREKIPGASYIYIPSGKYLKIASFGYSSLMADIIYLWAIQYYSNPSIVDRFDSLYHIFSIISELDPEYLDPYEIGALIAVYDAKDIGLALKILDMGLEKNPDQWIFPYQAGHYAQMLAKDYRLAQKYYKTTMEIAGAPAIAARLYANAAFKLGDYKAAWQNWLEVYESTEEERIKKIASNHLYRIKAAIDKKTINMALEKYREKYGHNPRDLSELVKPGLLESLPRDLDHKDYLYDAQTGKVKSPTIPWKR